MIEIPDQFIHGGKPSRVYRGWCTISVEHFVELVSIPHACDERSVFQHFYRDEATQKASVAAAAVTATKTTTTTTNHRRISAGRRPLMVPSN